MADDQAQDLTWLVQSRIVFLSRTEHGAIRAAVHAVGVTPPGRGEGQGAVGGGGAGLAARVDTFAAEEGVPTVIPVRRGCLRARSKLSRLGLGVAWTRQYWTRSRCVTRPVTV